MRKDLLIFFLSIIITPFFANAYALKIDAPETLDFKYEKIDENWTYYDSQFVNPKIFYINNDSIPLGEKITLPKPDRKSVV